MQDDEMTGIQALRAGNIHGLEALVRLHQLPALRVAYNLCADPQLAEDIVSEAFLTVHEHIDRYDISRPFGPWFYRIVVNEARSSMRQQRRVQTGTDACALLQNRADPQSNPESDVLHGELTLALSEEIALLPEKQRETIVLRYYLDMDERTIGELLRIPVGTVKWRLFMGRKRLLRRIAATQALSNYFYREGKTS